MNCTNCMSILPSDSKYCPQCGRQIDSTEKHYSETSEGNKSKFSKPSQAYILIFSAVAIAILIVVLILESNQDAIKEKKEISSNTQEKSPEIEAQLEKLNQDPESGPLNIEMGNLLFDSGKFDQAIPFYQKALTKNSQDIAVQIDLAVCFFNMRMIDQAILEMGKALELDPNHPKGLFNMGIIYYNIGDFEKVNEYWLRLITNNPELTEALRARELLKKMQ